MVDEVEVGSKMSNKQLDEISGMDVQSCLTNTCGSVGETQAPVNEQPIKKALTFVEDTRFGEEQDVKVIANKDVAMQHSN